MKATRNKTIDMSLEDGKTYLERCIDIQEPVGIKTIINKTIIGDCFDVMSLLPRSFVDL